MKDNLTIIITILSLLFVVVCATLYSGFVLTILWSWFITPVFGLPALSIPAAIGITFVGKYILKPHKLDLNKDEDKDYTTDMIMAFVIPSLVWFIGWVVHLFM